MTDPSRDLRVAAIIPVYRATFLAEALQSVFAQTRLPDDVIVVDDGSPDQDALAQALEPYSGRVSIVRQGNRGAAAARNAGLGATTAEYVALLDADDVWLPTFLAEQLAVLAAAPEIDLVYSDGLINGNTPLAGQTFMQTCPSQGPVTMESLIAQRCTVLLSSVVARRSVLVDAGGFNPDIRRGHDFDLWLRMAQRGARLTYQAKVLMLRRIHSDNLSGTAVAEAERPLRILEQTVRTIPLSDRERDTAERRMKQLRAILAREHGKEFLRVGEFAAARCEFSRARQGLSTWKISAALLAMRVAPQLVRKFYLTRAAAAEARIPASQQHQAYRAAQVAPPRSWQ